MGKKTSLLLLRNVIGDRPQDVKSVLYEE